jgi:peroxidase
MAIRTIDGSGNNATSPTFNATNTDFARLAPAHFADGVSSMVTGPNPREVSNVVVAGNGDLSDPNGYSGFLYAWGQFIDHDLDLSPSDGRTDITITAPDATIPMTRAVVDPTATPRTAVNTITGWLDASMVYGSEAATAASLRTADGHLLTSAGNNLPIVNGQFVAGDVRAAENPDLTALQVLFMREHNRLVDQFASDHKDWAGDQLYEAARQMVGAEIANITYSEFLPKILGPNAIAPYHGYDPTVDPRITEDFAGAAFRFGHSLVSGDIEAMDNNGEESGAEALKDVFFTSPDTFNTLGADGLLRHLASDISNKMDIHLIEDLRNFLFDPPSVQDLAAINIQRGRDLGLQPLNAEREALGLPKYTDFSQITSNPDDAAHLQQVYSSVDRIDLWTGGLSEDPAPGAVIGPTFQAILAHQFTALRDGDQFWFQNQGINPASLPTLGDVIEMNTDTQIMQNDAFVAMFRHASDEQAEEPNAPQMVIGTGDKGDRIVGGPQADMLVAGQANDQVMIGGAGGDQFVFLTNGLQATVADFNPAEDKLVFEEPPGNFKDVTQFIQGNAVIHAGGDTITLTGVDPNLLTQANFVVHHDII